MTAVRWHRCSRRTGWADLLARRQGRAAGSALAARAGKPVAARGALPQCLSARIRFRGSGCGALLSHLAPIICSVVVISALESALSAPASIMGGGF
jgi:hypothetical protein